MGVVHLWFEDTLLLRLMNIEDIMTGQLYVDLLSKNLFQPTKESHLDHKLFFNKTMTPNTQVAQQFLQKSKVHILKWLPQNLDLNPIENLWAILESKIPFFIMLMSCQSL